MAFDRTTGGRHRPAASLQQRAAPVDTRQQQQDNGTGEFQPHLQQGGWAADDGRHTLQTYLQDAALRGELPAPARAPRAALRLAK